MVPLLQPDAPPRPYDLLAPCGHDYAVLALQIPAHAGGPRPALGAIIPPETGSARHTEPGLQPGWSWRTWRARAEGATPTTTSSTPGCCSPPTPIREIGCTASIATGRGTARLRWHSSISTWCGTASASPLRATQHPCSAERGGEAEPWRGGRGRTSGWSGPT